VGDEGTAYLNYAGELAIWDEDNAAAGNYALYLGYKKDPGYSDDTVKISIKLFTSAGEEIIAEAHKDINASDNGTKLEISGTAIDADTIIEYSLNKSGKINKFIVVEEDASELGRISKSGTLIGTKSVASNIVVFFKDKNNDYSIEKLTNFQKDVKLEAESIVTKDKKIAAIFINKDNQLDSGEATYGVVNAVDTSVNEDKDKVSYVEGYIEGKELKAKANDLYSTWKETTTASGIAEITVNADGIVTGVTYELSKDIKVEDFKGATVESKDGDNQFVVNSETYQLADNVIIYVWSDKDKVWSAKTSISAIKKDNHIKAYQTDEDVEGFDVILIWE